MNCLLLSTPDLRVSPYFESISEYFDQVLCPKFSGLEALCSNAIEAEVQKLNQKILQDHHCDWFQALLSSSELLKNDDYHEQLKSIIKQLRRQSFIVNDPLLVYFLPLWMSLVERPKIVFHYSEPMECALALQEKWRFPIVFGLALWESYVLSASKNLIKLDYTLVSSTKLRAGDKSYLSSVSNEFGQVDLSALAGISELNELVHDNYSTKNIDVIFDLLENNQLAKIAEMSLSESSKDIIEHYGQLRFGYEKIKTERDQLQLSLTQAKLGVESANSLEQLESPAVDEMLCKVKVHIDGMDTIEFYADPASPVLDMLRMNLANPEQDQLIYLNCGESEDDTLYFMSSALLAMETEAVTTH